MGIVTSRGNEGRRLHVKKLVERQARAQYEVPGHPPGSAVQVLWEKQWHDAMVCADRGDYVDVRWMDGRYTQDVPTSDVKKVPMFAPSDKAEAQWEDNWFPVVILLRHQNMTYDVLWEDEGSRSVYMPGSMIRPRAGFAPKGSVRGGKQDVRIHGPLEVHIIAARGVPDADTTLMCQGTAGDPFCELHDSRGRTVARTQAIENVNDPVWQHVERGVTVPDTDVLHFAIKDEDIGRNEVICECVLCGSNGLSVVASGSTFSGWIPLFTPRGHPGGELNVKVRLLCPSESPNSPYEVAGTRFPMRTGHTVALYQSAHIGKFWSQKLAPVYTPNGGAYERENCWEQLCLRIMQAKEFIYVVGWSVNVGITLLRERPLNVPGYGKVGVDMTIGDMLRVKAKQGVKVCVLIWKEKTSLVGEGMAGTGSGQTFEYFKDTDVNCLAVFREGDEIKTAWLITHHQKGVMLDVPSPKGGEKRSIAAFVGGLDLTKGRWDTPGKELFATLEKDHRADFYQTMSTPKEHDDGASEGPRQPWQDIHSQIQGPAAHDLVENFENRWATQGDAGLLYHASLSKKIESRDSDVASDDDRESWNVQVFRSLDKFSDTSVRGIEADCHQAWIKAILRAEKFIYIENQYWMGGSDTWTRGKSAATSSNRIPTVLTERIVRAINHRDRFCAYVVLPLFPEGDPASRPMQEILYWQYETVGAMYLRIGDALQAIGSKDSPTDYLNFFCLGKRCTGQPRPVGDTADKRQAALLKYGRLPIYVHSKMIIVDDDYMVLGSCNVNDRSMAGDRDSEIAVGMHQPHYGTQLGGSGRGKIHAFRKSLWTEHLALHTDGEPMPKFIDQPESVQCIQWVTRRAKQAWVEHATNDLEGKTPDYENALKTQCCHLMKYPYTIDPYGNMDVTQKRLPDCSGKVRGRNSHIVPDFLTS
ncbi:Phospholipase D gamma 1 [Diplonema papillatum]|nr:Phospholipase D gamma 1 [Diplonema papillatum]KAJ9448729.1 Phospholipase D gamma 1 [Diplonema papillatum]